MPKIPSTLTPLQQANCDFAQAWKIISYSLFMSSSTLKDLEEAVKWCGETSHVSRTLSKANVSEYTNWIKDQWNNIMNGTLQIQDTPKYPSKSEKKHDYPVSWTSKICHILNPYDYPIIWDSKVRKWLKIDSNNYKDWNQTRESMRHSKSDERETCYLPDSIVWAIY